MGFDPHGAPFTYQLADLPTDISLLSGELRTVYEDGTPTSIADNVYLHHVDLFVFGKPSQPMSFCINENATMKLPVAEVFANSQDNVGPWLMTTPDGKFESGFYLQEKSSYFTWGEAVNYADMAKTVYLETEIEYVEGRPAGMRDVTMMQVSVTGCSSEFGFMPPVDKEGSFNATGPAVRIPRDGWLLNTSELPCCCRSSSGW